MNALPAKNAFVNDYEILECDRRISYPSYRSFDEFIDIERLRALDEYLIEKINNRINSAQEDYFVNLYRLDRTSPYQPGVREIWLSRTSTEAPSEYLDMVDKVELWEPTDSVAEFGLLMSFIETLPFKKRGRMLIIYDDSGTAVPAHRDHLDTEVCNEFIWFRTNLKKPFYVLNHITDQIKYVAGYSAWFDTVNQYHGSDACDGLSFSIRVDGIFTDEFRRQIPVPEVNAASTPAFWACLDPLTV